MLPVLTSQKEAINLAKVDLPEPEGPTKALTVPDLMVKEISCSTSLSSS